MTTKQTIKGGNYSNNTQIENQYNISDNKYGLLAVDLVNTLNNTNFAGLKYFPEDSKYKDINIRLFLKNIGQGYLTLFKEPKCSGYIYTSKVGENEKVELKLLPRGWDRWTGKTLQVQDTIELDYMLLISKWYEGKVGFNLEIFYKDVLGEYKHRLRFKNIDLQISNLEINDQGKLNI